MTDKQITIKVNDKDKAQLEHEARKKRLNLSSYIRTTLFEVINQNERN